MPSIINATTTTGLVSSADNSGSLQLATNNGTTAVTIDTGQNVGIGTASPNQKLQVNGNIMAANGTAGNPTYNFVGSSAIGMFTPDSGFSVAFSTSSTERMRITSTGVVQVGNNNGTGEVFAQNTVKVWGSIVGSNGSMYNSFGVSSSSKVSTGVYQINFSRTLSSARFGMGGAGYGGNYISGGAESTTETRVYVFNDAGTATDADSQFLIAGGS
jgi:hypothetical protein